MVVQVISEEKQETFEKKVQKLLTALVQEGTTYEVHYSVAVDKFGIATYTALVIGN